MKKTMTVMTMIFALALSVMGAAIASDTMLEPFTQDELDTNWQADRLYPSGGVTSVTFGGRNDVAAIAMDSTQASGDGSWWGYEGIKQVADHGLAVQVDLYVPTDFQTHPVNAGFWTSDAPTISAYPIIAFRNDDAVDAGFYTWDGVSAWAATGIDVNYDAWNTLSMTLDPDNGVVNYAINGQDAGSIAATGQTIGQVFLNQYNYGAIRDNAVDYSVHWHAGVIEIDSKDQCKDGNWENHPQVFKNQGQCIKFVNTGQ
jgi:hypothetical protein